MAVPKRSSSVQPDPQQKQAIEHIFGPMLVVAGAGTGKTTVLTRRIASLIGSGHARPHEILALTYTENAAAEMLYRVERDLGKENAAGLQIQTFHAYCNHLLHRYGRQFKVLDDKQLWIFLRRNIRELHLNHFVRAANVSKFLDDLLDFIRRCHDELVGPEDYQNYLSRIERGDLPIPRVAKSKAADELSDDEALARCREIAFVFGTAEHLLRERDFGTFGHMILHANRLLEEKPELLEIERQRARFILIDEFQDANFAQIQVLAKLTANDPGNIFAVGDPDQGIYRFRGASGDAFDLFQRQFPDTKVVALNKNRRSTTPILQSAFAIISQNPEFTLNRTDSRHRTALVSARDEEDRLKAAQRAPVEAVLVTGTFMEATDLVATLMERRRRSRCDWKDIAVLYRNHAHREEVATELARSNVPFSIEGLDVSDTPEVRDLLACARAVISSADSAAIFRVSALRQFEIEAEALRNAIRTLPRDSRASIATVLPSINGGSDLLRSLERARTETKGKMSHAALFSLTGIFQIPRNGAIQALLEFASAWQKCPIAETGELGEFLEYIDDFREARGTIPLPAREEENTVKLMTVHGAKGLEFEHVFVLRAVSPSFPGSYREPLIDFPRELRKSKSFTHYSDKVLCEQEERRLFYVAMTRARDTLTIYGPFGKGKAERTPAGYLRELLKNRPLQAYLRERNCRDFQTEIFAAAEPTPLTSRLGEWVSMPPGSDLASTLSASAIERYEICPLQFKLDREWRIPAEVSAALQYGASMHRVLRTYFDSVKFGRPRTLQELVQQFRDDLASEGITDRYQHDLYERQGIAQLTEFLASPSASPVLHTEEQFKVKVGNTALVGRIDRIDQTSEGVNIVDYKTGRPKSQEDADDSLQLSLYALAAREKWGYRAEALVFHNLEGNTAIVSRRTDAQLDEAKCRVADVADKIAAGRFEPKPGMHCTFCAYRFLCPKTEKRIPELAAVALEQGN